MNGKAIQTSRPGLIPFELKETVLVPLRVTAESLGNEVQSKKGVTYVPASFFESFFNEVVVQERNVSISAQMSSIQ
ncbi:hypothetical protein HUB98_21935 [Paenibacillus barcinonensis]|uniref:Copper amine oxidase-like protein n=1 Tax=Paenibacillus barcinonensis TaxID=198119 RepID=A0ABX6Q9A3_PAEBA|nr:hypothetical protein [Paenibacillus barcinonensis]QKS58622.1 hypothetical protein HUB98_21935 [Paenibacillus barcinonensis]